MNINYSKRIIKLIGISLIIPFSFFEIYTLNKQIKAEKNLAAASEKDLFLYRQMGASYLCIASKAEVDEKRLYNAGTFQIVGSALNICPESIPKNIKNDYEERLKQLVKKSKK